MGAFDLHHRHAVYQCVFLWFKLQDGRIAGLDFIRSDDLGLRTLRLFLGTGDQLRFLVFEGPSGGPRRLAHR